jgi:hypothetical protein
MASDARDRCGVRRPTVPVRRRMHTLTSSLLWASGATAVRVAPRRSFARESPVDERPPLDFLVFTCGPPAGNITHKSKTLSGGVNPSRISDVEGSGDGPEAEEEAKQGRRSDRRALLRALDCLVRAFERNRRHRLSSRIQPPRDRPSWLPGSLRVFLREGEALMGLRGETTSGGTAVASPSPKG